MTSATPTALADPPTALAAGADVSIRTFGGILRVAAAETGGALTVIEHELPAGRVALPLHKHERETETLHVLAGALTVQVGDAVRQLGPGEWIVLPTGVLHTFWNAGKVRARFLALSTPGGLEAYYAAVAVVVPPSGPADMDAISSLSQRYGLEFDMESLLDLVERHRVWLS